MTDSAEESPIWRLLSNAGLYIIMWLICYVLVLEICTLASIGLKNAIGAAVGAAFSVCYLYFVYDHCWPDIKIQAAELRDWISPEPATV